MVAQRPEHHCMQVLILRILETNRARYQAMIHCLMEIKCTELIARHADAWPLPDAGTRGVSRR